MKLIVLLGALLLLLNQVASKPVDEEDMQNDDYAEYDDDSNDGADDDEEEDVKFITRPQNFSAMPKTDVTLPCKIMGNIETFTLMWKKNNNIIFQENHLIDSDYNKPSKFMKKNTSLVIKNVDALDAGDYSCELVGTSAPMILRHNLSVHSPPKITSLTADKSTTEYKAGDKLELSCNVMGDPQPKITWSLYGKRLGVGDKLIVENLRHDNAGDYQCIADNGIEPVDHQSIHIKIMHKPVVTLERIISNINEINDTYDVELRCNVRSEPPAIVLWTKDGEEVKQTRKKNHMHILHLKSVGEKQLGKYSCRADNQLGKEEKFSEVTNAPSQAVYVQPPEGEKSLNFTWEVQSIFPISEYALEYKSKRDDDWKMEKPEVTNAVSSHLYFINHMLHNLDAGEYEIRVRAKNQYGWSKNSDIVSFTAQKAHRAHKHHNHHDGGVPTPNQNEEDNNIALETRVEGASTTSASSAVMPPSASLLCALLLAYMVKN